MKESGPIAGIDHEITIVEKDCKIIMKGIGPIAGIDHEITIVEIEMTTEKKIINCTIRIACMN